MTDFYRTVLTRWRVSAYRVRQRVALLRHHFALESDRTIYLALGVLQARRRTPTGASDQLSGYELRIFSQNGEDGALAEILDRIGAVHRQFVEFGIQDGREGNCVLLADVESWTGLFIEGDPGSFQGLQEKYVRTPAIRTVQAMVTPENLEQILAEAGIAEDLDVLSIDIDGQDYWIWEGMSRYRPRVLVVEYNSALPPDEQLVMPRSRTDAMDGTDYIGSSLAAFEALGSRRGYRLVHTDLTGLNAFFVREDLLGDRFPSAEDVPRRVRPNYQLMGVRYVRDPKAREYVRLDPQR